jgi:voltage-gated potassium channel Kch
MIAMLHIICCFWIALAFFNDDSNDGWLVSTGSQDSPDIEKYITALYWAVVTCTTVGYGDISPINIYEKIFVVVVMVCGVSTFSFQLSSLAQYFRVLNLNNNNYK